MRVRVSVEIPASPERVWADVARIETHHEWMADAETIRFESEARSGIGTEIVVLTRVGPFRTKDRMRFVRWSPPHAMGVEHRGLFSGEGEFSLEAIGEAATRFTWTESVRFPWYFGGPVGALVAKPLLALIWRRNLKRLRDRFSSR